MKKFFLIFAFAAVVFAQEDSTQVLDSLFSVEYLDTNNIVETDFSDIKIRPEILISIDSLTQTIVCEFLGNCDGKIIEMVSVSGNSVFEKTVLTNENTVSFSLKEFEKGIYVIRVLSPEIRRSVCSKAIIIG